jgi:hypothetical protein
MMICCGFLCFSIVSGADLQSPPDFVTFAVIPPSLEETPFCSSPFKLTLS